MKRRTKVSGAERRAWRERPVAEWTDEAPGPALAPQEPARTKERARPVPERTLARWADRLAPVKTGDTTARERNWVS